MNREEALILLKDKMKEENLVKHCLAVGAIMKGLAKELGESEEQWEICGILHDLDFEETKDDVKMHAIKSAEMLEGRLPPDSLHAIRAHNFENTGVNPDGKMDFALIAADAVSGLLIATALMRPTHLEGMKAKSVTKKFKQKDFARKCSREGIMFCERVGLERGRFFEIGIESLKNIEKELGL